MNPSRSRRPYVLLNMAMTADGKIATANRSIESFSSARDHAQLLRLRATADAVLCGARTANAEGVTLGSGGPRYERLRRRRGLRVSLLRIIVSGGAHLRPEAAIFRDRSSPIIVLVCARAPGSRRRSLTEAGATVVSFGRNEVDLSAAFSWLAQAHAVRRIVCEGGAELNDSMFRAHLIDEVHVTVCPKIFGGRDAPTIVEGDGFQGLARAPRLDLKSCRRAGDELFLVHRIARGRLVRSKSTPSQ